MNEELQANEMNITQEQLEALRWLLPQTYISLDRDGNILFDVESSIYKTLSHEKAAIFCDLLKRAVLAKDVETTDVRTFRECCFIRLVMKDGLVASFIDAQSNTELEAWILAVTELHGRMGK